MHCSYVGWLITFQKQLNIKQNTLVTVVKATASPHTYSLMHMQDTQWSFWTFLIMHFFDSLFVFMCHIWMEKQNHFPAECFLISLPVGVTAIMLFPLYQNRLYYSVALGPLKGIWNIGLFPSIIPL